MTDYLTNSADLTTVANAIRTKGGTTDSLVFPNGFANAIAAIPSGGGIENAVEINYDSVGWFRGAKMYGPGAVPRKMFQNNTTLASMEFVNVSKVFDNAFSGCTALATLSLGDGLTEIAQYGFEKCSALTTLDLPQSLSYIRMSAFDRCTGLKSVVFHGTPRTLMSNAFSGCSALTDIYVPWSSGAVSGAPWGATNATVHYEHVSE